MSLERSILADQAIAALPSGLVRSFLMEWAAGVVECLSTFSKGFSDVASY